MVQLVSPAPVRPPALHALIPPVGCRWCRYFDASAGRAGYGRCASHAVAAAALPNHPWPHQTERCDDFDRAAA